MIKKPFENTVDPAFLYQSYQHREALSRMLYAAWEHKPGFLLTGDYGTGKTLLSRAFIRELSNNKFRFVVISNPRLAPLEIMKEINYQLTAKILPPSSDKIDLLSSIAGALGRNYDENLYSVVIVDEAQSIREDSLLEELRLLLNIQRDDSILFTLILLGQSCLLEDIEKAPQFKQRLSIRYNIQPLNKEDTSKYIQHRLNVAGLDKKIFTDSAFDEVFLLSGGVPRVINNVCDLALLTGFIKNLNIIDREIVVQAGKDLEECFSQELKEKENG